MTKEKLPAPLSYKNSTLYFDKKSLKQISKELKTPFYLYSEKVFLDKYNQFLQSAHQNQLKEPLICFALKANPNLRILKSLAKAGCGADIVSGGELKRALEAKIDPMKIVFSGVAKSEEEITMALKASKQGIYSFNIESIDELETIQKLAKKFKKKARVAIRFNPQVVTKTHKHISTGYKTHKFGLVKKDLLKAIHLTQKSSHIVLAGLSMHIGSQLTCLKATEKALIEFCAVINEVKEPLEFIDLGGGLGVNYKRSEKISTINDYMKVISKILNRKLKRYPSSSPRIVFEPGRYIAAEAGILVTKVVRTKLSENSHFTIVDGGMNNFIRTSLYDAFHMVLPVSKSQTKKIITNVVGPICETADKFAADLKITAPQKGDYLCVCDTGAYGYSMASNYNLREQAREYVLSSNGKILKA